MDPAQKTLAQWVMEQAQELLPSVQKVSLMNNGQSGEKVCGILLMLLLVGLAFCPLCIEDYWEPDYFGSDISYSLMLETDVSISNATFLIPLPMQNGIPAIGLLNLTEGMFIKPGYNASFVSFEGDWYVRLTADAIHPIPGTWEYEVSYGDRSLRADYDARGYEVEYRYPLEYPYWINTRQPLGNETIFLPKFNMSVEEPAIPSSTTGRGTYWNPVVIRYRTKMYSGFDSPGSSSVDIKAYIHGYNTWVERFQGSEANSYSDSLSGHFSRSPSDPPSAGWHLVSGEMKTGSGRYLNVTY